MCLPYNYFGGTTFDMVVRHNFAVDSIHESRNLAIDLMTRSEIRFIQLILEVHVRSR